MKYFEFILGVLAFWLICCGLGAIAFSVIVNKSKSIRKD